MDFLQEPATFPAKFLDEEYISLQHLQENCKNLRDNQLPKYFPEQILAGNPSDSVTKSVAILQDSSN